MFVVPAVVVIIVVVLVGVLRAVGLHKDGQILHGKMVRRGAPNQATELFGPHRRHAKA
jgi:hypothetical protein